MSHWCRYRLNSAPSGRPSTATPQGTRISAPRSRQSQLLESRLAGNAPRRLPILKARLTQPRRIIRPTKHARIPLPHPAALFQQRVRPLQKVVQPHRWRLRQEARLGPLPFRLQDVSQRQFVARREAPAHLLLRALVREVAAQDEVGGRADVEESVDCVEVVDQVRLGGQGEALVCKEIRSASQSGTWWTGRRGILVRTYRGRARCDGRR